MHMWNDVQKRRSVCAVNFKKSGSGKSFREFCQGDVCTSLQICKRYALLVGATSGLRELLLLHAAIVKIVRRSVRSVLL